MNRGRPRKAGKPRKKCGRIKNSAVDSRQDEAAKVAAFEARLSLEAGTWKRRQEAALVGEDLTVDEARLQEQGSVLHRWLKTSEMHRAKGREHLALITREQFDALNSFQELSAKYTAMFTKRAKSSTDFERTGGHDNIDPWGEMAARDKRTHKDYKAARTAILEASPLAMMAIETIVFENKESFRLVGDLRLGANALSNLKRVRRAA